MEPHLIAERLHLGADAALVMLGAVTAWSSTNVAKRLVGLVIANIAVMLALASLHAPDAALLGVLAIALAQFVIGAALVVRLQESYGVTETPELDGADEQGEPAEPGA